MAALPIYPAAVAGLLCGTLGLPAVGHAAESAYTDLDIDACTVLSRQEEEGGSVEMRCPGYRDVPVFFSEGDLRADVDFGASDGVFSTFGAFNNIAGKIEWRHAAGKPFAAILRYNISTGTNEGAKGDVLLVAKVGRKGAPGCPVAVVDVSTVQQANGVARGAAALAPKFDCKTDKPIAIGAANSLAETFTQAVAEGE